MRIALLCATRRGLRVLQGLAALVPQAELLVFSFREEAHEPPFMDDIRAFTEAHGGHFYETRQVGAARWRELWDAAPVDLMLIVSWRYLVPPEVYDKPLRGTFVFHDSPLPAYRGFAPTVWAMVNGESETGATLFEIAPDVDSGQIVAQERVPIGEDDTIADVIERVTEAYLALLTRWLPALLDGSAPRAPQDESAATYTCKRLPEDNQIDWEQPARVVYNLIRAVTRPYPGAFTTLKGERLIVWGARRLPSKRYVGAIAGRVVEIRPGEGVVVLTGDGALLLTEVQLGDTAPVPAAEALNSIALTLGR